MSTTASKKPATRPIAVGDVFRVPLPGGLFGLCLVVAKEKPLGPQEKSGRWRVVTCAWTGPAAEVEKAIKRPKALAPLELTRLKRKAHVQSIGYPVPARLKHVGSVALSAEHLALRGRTVGAWEWIQPQITIELEFRADPERVRQKFAAANKQATERRREAFAEADRKRKARPTPKVGTIDAKALKAFARMPPLSGWRKYHPVGFVSDVRAALQEFAQSQITTPPTRLASVKSALRRTTKAVNARDRKWKQRIMTPDAEEVVEALINIATAAGMGEEEAEETIDEMRDF